MRLSLLMLCTVVSSPWVLSADIERTPLIQATHEVAEAKLLDVSILLFDPGLPEPDPRAEEKKGVFPAVRKAEARFIPLRLMETLQASGFWGAVRVVPPNFSGGEIRITGEIIVSNGFKQVLKIEAVDATGKRLFRKRYRQIGDPASYRRAEDELMIDAAADPFQYLYNRIANDLLEARRKTDTDHLARIRQVNTLRFAQDLAPDAFEDYLDERGRRRTRYRISKLPADGDPMMRRVAMIRERDALLIDTLTAHYQDFGLRMADVYRDWRHSSYEEEKSLRQIRRQARNQQILGALLILGGLVREPDNRAESGLQQAGIMAGGEIIRQGMIRAQDVKLHREALQELAVSLESEVQPMLIELRGRTVTLTGTAESRYAAWREILREMFVEEMGLTIDPDTGEPISGGGNDP